MATPNEIVAFLLSKECSKVVEANPVLVTVDGETFPAARYKEDRRYEAGMDAVTRGGKKAGDPYPHEAIYVVGPLPKLKAQGRNVAFTIPGEPNEWYVACHHNGHSSYVMDNFIPAPPFGRFYILMPWDLPNKIDQYERHPYRRVELRLSQEA